MVNLEIKLMSMSEKKEESMDALLSAEDIKTLADKDDNVREITES